MSVTYLALLLAASSCVLLIDWRYQLFFWRDPVAAMIVSGIGVAFFLGWDVAGISLGIFFRGEGPAATGILLAPHLPLEEPIFLLFLVLCTMVLYTGSVRILGWRRRVVRGTRRSGEEIR